MKEYRQKIEQIFSDVPVEHRFWLVKGGEVKNLEELETALKEMDDKTFSHHVDESKNDFAGWIKNVVKDEELGDTLFKIKTKESTIKAVELRINSLKNLQSIHQAIDSIKEKIDEKHEEVNEDVHVPEHIQPQKDEDDVHDPLEEPKEVKVHGAQSENMLKRIFLDVSLYVGLLVGFILGVVMGYFM